MPNHLSRSVLIALFLLTFSISVNAQHFTSITVSIYAVPVDTAPADLAFTVDSAVYHSAQTFNWEVGSSHTISVAAAQETAPGTRYRFNSWSDWGEASHTIVVPERRQNFTAIYELQYLLTMVSEFGTTTPGTSYQFEGAWPFIRIDVPFNCVFRYWEGQGFGSYTGSGQAFVRMYGPITEIAHMDCYTPSPTNTATPTPTATPPAAFDYDGDRRSDISVFRASEANWYLQRASGGVYGLHFGLPDDKIVPADYDGDLKTDIAVFRPSEGVWYVLDSATDTVSYNYFGRAGDVPVPADYDGDGKSDLAVFRRSDATWYWQQSSDGSYQARGPFGNSEDVPTVGDYDGDGKADISVIHGSYWYRINSSDGQLVQWGSANLPGIPTQADYDGDHKTDMSFYRSGIWQIAYSSGAPGGPPFNASIPFGLPADIPVPGDYDGDGKADLCVFSPSDGMWYGRNSSNGEYWSTTFGLGSDKPTESAFQY